MNKISFKKRDLLTVFMLACCPFLMYLHEFFPANQKEIQLFGKTFESGYFYDWSTFFWTLTQKIIPLILLIVLFFYVNRVVSFFILPVVILFVFQVIAIMYDQMSPIDSLALDFGFILPIAVFVGIMLFIVKRKYERGKIKIAMHEAQLKEKMISLKHQALNAQMNPHFINNLLLHIYVALEKGNQKNSLSDLGNFSQLVSLVLKSTKSDFISLDDELKIADYYFKLQQSRFEHKFQYSIQNKNLNDEDLELIKVPPMILQPIIENAIEHGIRTQNAKGIIALQLSEDKEYLHCEIIDNGIGYSKSKAIQKKYHSGISLKNIEERLQIMDAKNSKTKLIKIEDKLNTNQEIVGTKVTLKVPLVA